MIQRPLHTPSVTTPDVGSQIARVMRGVALAPWFAAAACVLLAVPGTADAGQSAIAHVAACGLEFDLPAGYKITRPKRMVDARDGASCSFDIVKARPDPPQQGECKDEEDSGQPPFDVCDWMIDGGPASPSVRVARVRPGGRPLLDDFVLDDSGRWNVTNAQAGDQPAQAIDFHGMPAWTGEAIVRMSWYRARVKDFTGIYAGSGGSDVTLVQFASDLFVDLHDPPLDANDACTTFCASLRLGARTQDLP